MLMAMVKKSAAKPQTPPSAPAQAPETQSEPSNADTSALLDLLMEGAQPRQALVAKALLDQQDAEQALREAQTLKAEAMGHGPRQRLRAVENEEEAAIELRRQAEEELRLAGRILAEAEENWTAIEQAKVYAASVRAQADQHAISARADADAQRDKLLAKAGVLADEDRERQLATQTAQVVIERQRAEEAFHLALRRIDDMQQAVQAELDAQAALTNAIRLNAITRSAPSPRGS